MIKRRGFTLLELLIVVVVIGILAAIALPQYTSTLEKAKAAEALGNLGTLRAAMDRYWYDQMGSASSYTAATLAKLDIDNPNDTTGAEWSYILTDSTTGFTTKAYVIEAQRIGKTTTHWVQINQDGDIRKSTTLGGSGTKFGE